MRFKKKFIKKFAKILVEKNLQSLKKIRFFQKIFENFRKFRKFRLKIFDFWKFSIEMLLCSIFDFPKISGFFDFRKMLKLWRIFSMKKFAIFLLFFFVNRIRNISFPRIKKIIRQIAKLLIEKFSQVWKKIEKSKNPGKYSGKYFNWISIEKFQKCWGNFSEFFGIFSNLRDLFDQKFSYLSYDFFIRGNEMLLMRFAKKNQ